MEISTVLIFASFILALYFFLSKRRPKGYPPGPSGIPLFGNIFQMGMDGHEVILKWTEKYGEIIGAQIGLQRMVVFNDVDDMKDVFNKIEFTGRNMFNTLTDELCDEKTSGVIFSSGKIWQEQRRFCLRTLKDFGFGKKSMETIIMEETNDLIEEFKKLKEQPISTKHTFNCAVFNVIWSIVAGERYPHDDPQLEELMKLLLEILNSSMKGIVPFFILFPGLVDIRDKVPFLFPDGKKFKNKAFAFFRKTIQNHRDTMVEGNPRDLIDTFLEEVAKTTDPTSSFHPKGSDDLEIILLLTDLFMAGAETTSTTLIWSFYLLALHKEVQEKFYHEIQTVVGNRQVSLNDKPSLPYVEATMLEILRVSTLVPLGVPHSAIQDTVYKNYVIPKGTIIAANVYAAHYRTSVWGDPKNFRPERFLSSDGKTIIKNKHLIPFGVGKRACLGESLARDEFFLFVTNLVQAFNIGMPDDEPAHTLKLIPGGMSSPEPHKIVLKERHA